MAFAVIINVMQEVNRRNLFGQISLATNYLGMQRHALSAQMYMLVMYDLAVLWSVMRTCPYIMSPPNPKQIICKQENMF